MKKIQTLSMLQDVLDSEFSWRLKEIVGLRMSIASSAGANKRTLMRATIALLYAHWEGFVKNASSSYLVFINCQKCRFEQLSSCFIALGVKKKLASLVDSNNASQYVEAVEFFVNNLNDEASVSISIDTKSNLSSKVFNNIATSIGIPVDNYAPKYNLIDESLLSRRNKIAHGEYLDITSDRCEELIKEVLGLMRLLKNDILNSAAQMQYLRTGMVTGNIQRSNGPESH